MAAHRSFRAWPTMKIVNSTHTESNAQADGRVLVTERHVFADGRMQTFTYLAGVDMDPALVMSLRAARLESEDDARELAQAEALRGKLLLTHLDFRRRFTLAERRAIDRLRATFESGGWTDEQKDCIRTLFADMDAAMGIDLVDVDTIAGVQFFAVLGLITADRAVEILRG